MSFKEKPLKEYGPKTPKEHKIEVICGAIAMVLMATLIIILIVASSTDMETPFAEKRYGWISTIVIGSLIVICIIVYAILKSKFKKQRRIKEIKMTVEGEENNNGQNN
ncbi:MAG: hypothetical protein HUJ52_00580 [Malacoplasma sp.]|nr:hypothetical protein [Malacoplasma sp.]